VSDQDRTIDERIIEHARHVVREIFDGHARRIARQRRTSVPSVMRMDTVAVS
jgi:hypothetical protein